MCLVRLARLEGKTTKRKSDSPSHLVAMCRGIRPAGCQIDIAAFFVSNAVIHTARLRFAPKVLHAETPEFWRVRPTLDSVPANQLAQVSGVTINLR
jgi:hypothetical protein